MLTQFRVGYEKLSRQTQNEIKKFSVAELSNQQIVKMQLEDFLDLAVRKQGKVTDSVINTTEFEGIKEWFIEIKKLHNGDYFGELALLNNAPRAATITTTEPSSFAVIDRVTYKKVLMKIEEKNKEKITTFLTSLPLFKNFPRKNLNNLHLSFEQRNYIYSQVVYFENTKPEYVYFVEQGEFELVKTPKKHRPTDLTLDAHDLLGPER
jgi:hypothetical protein